MDTQKIRTIVIATLTAASFFILISWIFPGCLFCDGVFNIFLVMLRWTCIPVILFAVLVFAAMSGWTVSIGWKLLIAILHIIFACVGALWICFWWSVA